MSEATTLHPETINAIIGGYHGDVFSVLGQHNVEGDTVVRVFEPAAMNVTVLANDGRFPLTKVHPDGFYEGTTPDQRAYKLEIEYPDTTITRADAYSLGSTLTDYDRYLLGEGTDMRLSLIHI